MTLFSSNYWLIRKNSKLFSTVLGIAGTLTVGISHRAEAAQPPTTLPVWSQTVADCVTGDNNFDSEEFDTPDAGCDNFNADLYERPFTSGEENAYRPDQDIVQVQAAQDSDWFYFRIELYGVRSGELTALYGIEVDTDGDGCTDWLWSSETPTAEVRDNVGLDRWGQKKVIAYYDSNNDVGGSNCVGPDNGNGDGYNQEISKEGSGSDPDGLWAMSPSGESNKVVILAVQKSMVAAQNGGQLPSSIFWRGWADRGDRDPGKYHYHDEYTAREAGDPYDEDNPSDKIRQQDNTNGLDNLNELTLYGYDYGDAPAAYGTLDSNNGPNHIIVDGLYLGSLVDADTDGFGDGVDDNGGAADDSPGDDGVTTFARLYDSSFDDVPVYSVNVNVTNTTGSTATLVGWIDFDRNNQFDPDEAVIASVPDGTNAQTIPLLFNIPGDIQAGTSYARFRITTDAIDGNNSLGAASDGEVEDYVMTISSALPLPTNLTCGNAIQFPWEGDPGGFIWNVDDTANTYTIPNLYDVEITLLDPHNQNLDTANPGTFSPPGYTQTAGVFGGGKLTWSMTSTNDTQTVTLQIKLSEPSLISNMTIADIDGVSYIAYANAGFANPTEGSFQDEVTVSASFRGDNVPVNLSVSQAGLMTISGQTARGGYGTDFSTAISASDPQGHLNLSTTAAIDTLVLEYSNGPDDKAAEGVGISDDHSIAINLWTFCEAFPDISGVVWDDDFDGDGIRDLGESGVSGVGVELYEAADRNNPNASPIAVTTTAGDGSYIFTNQIPGDYFVRVVPFLGKGFTSPDQGGNDAQDSDADANGYTADFTLVSGVNQENWDAGLITVTVGSAPDVLLVKRITAISGNRTENPNDNTPLNVVTTDDGSTHDEHARWPGGYLRGATNAGFVKPGDEIEYTIYFLNAGDRDAANVRICDLIQPYQSFVLDAYGTGTVVDGTGDDLQLQLGNSSAVNLTTANDANDRTQLIASGANVPTDRDCNLQGTNADGVVVVVDITGAGGTGEPPLITLPGSTDAATPNDAYGFVRFMTRVDE